ncbi:MAG: hypothetical protein LBC31_12455 [Treponema sp.]|jgi:hypothetical protein|nr:hypothetical protein [Treponema sp.]
MTQVQITLPDNVMDAVRAEAARRGITPNVFIRIMLCETYAAIDTRVVRVPVENYTELLTYAKVRKLGDVEHLAVYAIDQYMKKFPLKTASKSRDGESVEN